jgi:SAM-dependent methyltransferase
MPVHEIAQRGFDAEALTYDRTRPSYPPDAVAWLVEHLRIGPGRRVVDLAAGTGKLTTLLAPLGAQLLAVEPVAGMRQILRAAVPDVPTLAATAEELPFADGSLDAVTAAQAFHWFDAERALPEIRRVLRPGGRLGLLWNARDRSVDWVDRIWGVMDRVEKHAPWRDHEQWSEHDLPFDRWFGTVHRAEFRQEQLLTPEDVVGRFKGVSHVAVLPPAEQAAVLDEVRGILATHPDTAGRDEVRIPYRVDAYWCERRP